MGRAVIIALLMFCANFLYASPPVSGEYGQAILLPPGAVIIDPGHGGRDPGAVARTSSGREVYEKDIALRTSLMLRDLLEEHMPEINVSMTREDDTFLSLQQRVQFANSVLPPPGTSRIFLSIHANAAPQASARGFEIWTYRGRKVQRFLRPEADDPFFEAIAQGINNKMHQEMLQATDIFAETVHKVLSEHLSGAVVSRGIKEQEFFVIRYSRMPALLIEMGFMTNPDELDLLLSDEYSLLVAQALTRAIKEYGEGIP